MHCLHTRLNVCARTGFPTGVREKPPPQIACGRRSRLSSNVHTSRHEKRRYRAYVEVLWVGLPARYLRGGNVRGRGLQKSRWRVRSVCIVPTHPDGQDCDILRYCALFSILNGALRLAMAHRPPDLVAIFRAVSNPCWCGMVRPDRRPVPVPVMVAVPPALSRLHCPPPLEPWPGALRGRLGWEIISYPIVLFTCWFPP